MKWINGTSLYPDLQNWNLTSLMPSSPGHLFEESYTSAEDAVFIFLALPTGLLDQKQWTILVKIVNSNIIYQFNDF